MIIVLDKEYFEATKKFGESVAEKLDTVSQLDDRLKYLSNYADEKKPTVIVFTEDYYQKYDSLRDTVKRILDRYKPKLVCLLEKDFAPYSFTFQLRVLNEKKEYAHWFSGGLIFHGSHDGFGSGGAPSFSCCLTKTDGWSVHT